MQTCKLHGSVVVRLGPNFRQVFPCPRQAAFEFSLLRDYASGFVGRDIYDDARRMEAAANRAIALDPNLAAGHQMRGLFLKGFKWDFPNAEAAYKRALQLDPQNAWAAVEYADLLWETGRIEQAAEQIHKARALQPAFPALAVKEAEIQLDLGHTDVALATARAAIKLRRTSLRAHVALGMAYERRGDHTAALTEYANVLRADPSDRRALPAYGYLLGITGQTARAREIVAQLQRMNTTVRNCAVQIAVVYAALGEDKIALDWLETAWRTRQAHFPFAAVECRLRRFHGNERFREILRRAGLKPASVTSS
jgi:tetratricopeptide (TPR) repeat protein